MAAKHITVYDRLVFADLGEYEDMLLARVLLSCKISDWACMIILSFFLIRMTADYFI